MVKQLESREFDGRDKIEIDINNLESGNYENLKGSWLALFTWCDVGWWLGGSPRIDKIGNLEKNCLKMVRMI